NYFDSEEILKFASLEILRDHIKDFHFLYLLRILNKRNYYNEKITEIVINLFNTKIKDVDTSGNNEYFDRYDIEVIAT
ncbi:MAG: hypothetical protein NTZ42_00155, partial [Candidatus Gribaldobacteria bacterium]|nr:hypothetical protein [Candidatus Gribaldobacteria bacterium]